MLSFLDRILAGGGIRCGVVLDPKTRKPIQRFFETNAVLEVWLRANMNRVDAYHCNATFKTRQNRKKENAAFYRAVWVDCDLKFDAALPASAAFCKASEVLRPSILVASGGGCHLYWVFTRDITLGEWERAAGLLKRACAALHFEIDGKCTIDAVRILRPPETLNHKYDPKPVVEAVELEPDYDCEEFVEKLAAIGQERTAPASIAPTSRARGTGHDGFDSAVIPIEGPPSHPELIAEKCAHIQDFKETGCREYEPLWYAALGVSLAVKMATRSRMNGPPRTRAMNMPRPRASSTTPALTRPARLSANGSLISTQDARPSARLARSMKRSTRRSHWATPRQSNRHRRLSTKRKRMPTPR
jgi:hypothetical protein